MQVTSLYAASGVGGDALRATVILAVMCVAMWFLARVARRRLGVGAGTVAPGALKVVGRRSLDQRSSLWIVEIGGRHVLLGSGADGTVTKLDDISAEEFAAMSDPPAGASPILSLRRGSGGDADDAAGVGAGDEPPRFATVGESFQLLLDRARGARDARRASGDDE